MTHPIESFLADARDAGLPPDQVSNFLRAGYVPQPKQMELHAMARVADGQDGPDQILFGGARGGGKALALDTPIPVPGGWSTMGELRAGDLVYAPDGSTTRVVGCSEIMHGRPCYEVVFSDGQRIVADADHLWLTLSKGERQKRKRRTPEYRAKRRATRLRRGTGAKPYLVKRNQETEHDCLEPPVGGLRTTRELFETLTVGGKGETNHAVVVSEPIWGPEADLPVDPYVLGAWLGDGDSGRGYLTTVDAEILDEVRSAGFGVVDVPSRGISFRIDGLNEKLAELGVRSNKHIPSCYLRVSVPQRLALLQGLCDTDGTVTHAGCIEFTSTKREIADGVLELALSLGIKATCSEGEAKLNGERVGPKWRVRFTSTLPCFRLRRKLDLQNMKPLTDGSKLRYVREVNPVESVPVRCIKVEREDGMFLAGRGFIPTHNSHAIFAQIAFDDCQRIPGLKVLYLRKAAKQAREQFEDLRRNVLGEFPHDYRRGNGVVEFTNGSRIFIGHFRDEKDVDAYLGIEYDLIVVEELTTLSASKYQALRDSNRTSKPGWRPRMYMSTNPGGIGHAWVRHRFVDPYKAGSEEWTRYIPATLDHNAFVDEGYRRKVEENTGWRLQAYRYGSWDIAVGQFFTTWREDVHVVRSFPLHKAVQAGWPIWAAMDYGFSHPTVFLFGTQSPTGVRFVIGEYHGRRTLPPDHARNVREYLAARGIPFSAVSPWVAGKDIFARRGDSSGLTIAEQYSNCGIHFEAANMDRVNGWAEILDGLGDLEADPVIKPTLYVFNVCRKLIEQMPAMVHNDRKPEDILKVDADSDGIGGDDAVDALRYLINAKSVGAVGSEVIEALDPIGVMDSSAWASPLAETDYEPWGGRL